MSIKEVMSIGTNGMSKAQTEVEQERRLKVVERINRLGAKIAASADKKQIKWFKRELNRIKGEEHVWLKEAAWFLYT